MAPARSRPRSQTSSTSASARWPASARSPPTSCAFGRVSSRSSSPTRVAPDSASTAAAMSRWPCASSPSSRTRDTPFPAPAQVLKAEFRQKQPQLSLIASDLPDTKQLRNLRRELAALATMLSQPVAARSSAAQQPARKLQPKPANGSQPVADSSTSRRASSRTQPGPSPSSPARASGRTPLGEPLFEALTPGSISEDDGR